VRHLRPTGALEMFDRTFLVWRRRPLEFLGWGALSALPALVVELIMLWRSQREPELSPLAVAPWAFLAFLLQLLPVTLAVRLAFVLLLRPSPSLSRLNLRRVLWAYPRLVVTVLATLFGGALFLQFGLAATEAFQPSLVSVIALLLAVGVALWFAANMAPAVVLVATGLEELFDAWRSSWRLMLHTRISSSWWRENAYWRLALLSSFPLICHGLLAAALRIGYWADTGVWLGIGDAPLAFSAVETVAVAAADAFLVPWGCIALVSLFLELAIRLVGLDFQIRLGGLGGVDSATADE
jgi:hypothetical protein